MREYKLFSITNVYTFEVPFYLPIFLKPLCKSEQKINTLQIEFHRTPSTQKSGSKVLKTLPSYTRIVLTLCKCKQKQHARVIACKNKIKAFRSLRCLLAMTCPACSRQAGSFI